MVEGGAVTHPLHFAIYKRNIHKSLLENVGCLLLQITAPPPPNGFSGSTTDCSLKFVSTYLELTKIIKRPATVKIV